MNIVWFLLIFVLISCAPVIDPFEEENISNTTLPFSEEEHHEDSIPDTRTLKEERYAIKKAKELEAKGLGLYNFSALTAENCETQRFIFQQEFSEFQEDIIDAEEKVDDEIEDVAFAEQELRDAELSDNENFINKKKEDLDKQIGDLDYAEYTLKSLEKIKEKYEIVLDNFKRECKILHAGV